MGDIKPHLPVKLIVAFIFGREDCLLKAKQSLEKKFGRIDFESRTLSFNCTDYYEKELGRDLKRKFFSFEKLIPASSLARIKIITNKIETALSRRGMRKINIDPGYLELSKLVLASTKDYNHRLYLDKGIFAEITLNYQKGTFQPWDWTYPDYKTKEYIEIFNQIRAIYQRQISKIVKFLD